MNGYLKSQFVINKFQNLNDIYYKLIENNYQIIYELYNNAEK